MTYTVVWAPDAEEELVRIWIRSGSRQHVTSATDKIDRLLRMQPQSQGEPWFDKLTLHVPPLLVVYEVIPDDRIVRIIQVITETN
jgi:hypothetical protein